MGSESACLSWRHSAGLCSTSAVLVSESCFLCCRSIDIVWGVWQFVQPSSPASTWEADKDLSEGLSACLILLSWLFHSSLIKNWFLLTTVLVWTEKSCSLFSLEIALSVWHCWSASEDSHFHIYKYIKEGLLKVKSHSRRVLRDKPVGCTLYILANRKREEKYRGCFWSNNSRQLWGKWAHH